MESRKNSFDIVIVGGGLVGGTLALALAKLNFRIAILDENDPKKLLSDHVDGRSYAISLGSKRILDDAGIWTKLRDKTHPIETIKIGSEASNLPLTYHYSDVADEPLGFLLDATLLRKTILSLALKDKRIQWCSETVLKDAKCELGSMSVTPSSGDDLHCHLLIAADGGNSKTRELMGIHSSGWSYDQLALVFNVKHAGPHHNTAFELFTSEGPFAMLPYPDDTSGCVWSLRKDYAEEFLELSEAEKLEVLNIRFSHLLGDIEFTSPVKSFPLRVNQPHVCTRDRFALVGDAAHAMHPVAGQGLNLGFRDVEVLVDELKKAQDLGLDIGGQSVLKAYQRRRRTDNLSLLAMTDLSARGFATNQPVLRWAFDRGFRTLNKIGIVKKYMMRHAMGLS